MGDSFVRSRLAAVSLAPSITLLRVIGVLTDTKAVILPVRSSHSSSLRMYSKETKRPSADSSATCEYVAGIEDLVLQILLRLPAKSLIRFKLVSKHWQSLISDPKFVQSHVPQGNPNSIIPLGMFVDVGTSGKTDFFWLSGSDQDQTLYRASPSLDFIDKAFRKLGRGFMIVSSCHGLLLCCCKYYPTCPLCVCNPTTRKYRFIPNPDSVGWSISGLGFGFDPSVSPHYKIICVRKRFCQQAQDPRGIGSWHFEVEVYSSEDHCWRLLLQFNDPSVNFNSNGMYWNGGIHWVGEHSFHFDMSTESLVKRKQPCCPQTLEDSVLLYRLKACDKYAYAFNTSYVKFYVFELSADNYEWVLKNSVHVCDLTETYPEIVTRKRYYGRWELNYEVFALGVVEGLKEMDSTLLLAIPNKIISYRFSDKAMKTLYELPARMGRSEELFYVRTYPFIETLSTV